VIYEIINPSDCVTIDAPTFEAAALATILIGNGQYGAKPDDGGEDVPIFLFSSWRAWVKERFGFDEAEQMLEAHKVDVIAALKSACTGSISDRKLFDSALAAITDDEKRAAFLADWDDKKRTSMTAIANAAHDTAKWLEGDRVAPVGEG
jgi:hypothetical protein